MNTLPIIQHNKSYCFPQCTSLSYVERLSLWKTWLAVSDTHSSSTQSLDPMDKSPNHTTIAADSAHSHRPHEKGRGERGKSDFHGSGQPDKRLWNSTASGQNHMTLAHRKSPKLSIVWDNIKIPLPRCRRRGLGGWGAEGRWIGGGESGRVRREGGWENKFWCFHAM